MQTLPSPLHCFADFSHACTAIPFAVPMHQVPDTECWEKMFVPQTEYHCYTSARLEAAVEMLESGYSVEEVPMRE
jgi:hypothetical protein